MLIRGSGEWQLALVSPLTLFTGHFTSIVHWIWNYLIKHWYEPQNNTFWHSLPDMLNLVVRESLCCCASYLLSWPPNDPSPHHSEYCSDETLPGICFGLLIGNPTAAVSSQKGMHWLHYECCASSVRPWKCWLRVSSLHHLREACTSLSF